MTALERKQAEEIKRLRRRLRRWQQSLDEFNDSVPEEDENDNDALDDE
jgi:hypothetical protein